MKTWRDAEDAGPSRDGWGSGALWGGVAVTEDPGLFLYNLIPGSLSEFIRIHSVSRIET